MLTLEEVVSVIIVSSHLIRDIRPHQQQDPHPSLGLLDQELSQGVLTHLSLLPALCNGDVVGGSKS